MFSDGVALTSVSAAECGGVIGGGFAVIERGLVEGSHGEQRRRALWDCYGFPVFPLGQHGKQLQTSFHQHTNPTRHIFFENTNSSLESTFWGEGGRT